MRTFPLLPAICWLLLAASQGIRFKAPSGPAEVEDYAAGNPLERAVYSSLIVTGAAILWRRRQRAWPLLRRNAALLVLFAFMALSVLWSPFPLVSLKRLIKSAGGLILMATVLTEEDPRAALARTLEWFLTLALCLSLFFILALPSVGIQVRFNGAATWVGITPTKNNLGQLAALGGLFFLWRISASAGIPPLRRVMFLILLAVSLLLLAKAGSMASLGTFTGGAGLMLFLLSLGRMGRLARMAAAAALAFLVLSVPVLVDLLFRQDALAFLVAQSGKDMDFTGRTYLWADVWKLAQAHLLLGSGYGGFWVGDLGNQLWSRYVWQPNQAHNGYLDVIAQLGLAGGILTALVVVHAWRTGLVRLREDQALALAVVAGILFNNLFESSLLRLNHLYWMVFLLLSLRSEPEPTAEPLEAAGGAYR